MARSQDELRAPDVPLLEGEVYRLYSFRICPYAQRARLISAAKGIKYDLVNIDLNKKPEWFFDLNPYGEVPVVVYKGNRVYESLIVAEYLEEAFPKPKLMADDPLVRAWERIYYNHWHKKGIPAFYSLLKMGCKDPEQTVRLEGNIKVMDEFLEKLDKPYFHGDCVGFSDYMIWPWFERMPVLQAISDFEVSADKFPRIAMWMKCMLENPVVQECHADINVQITHYTHYRTGKPDFTIGSTKPKPVEEALENLDGLRDPSTRDRQTKSTPAE